MLCIFIKIRFSKNKLTLNPLCPASSINPAVCHQGIHLIQEQNQGYRLGLFWTTGIFYLKKKKSDICFVRLIAV